MRLRAKLAVGVLGLLLAGLLSFQTPLLRGVRDTVWTAWVYTVGSVLRIGTLALHPDVTEQLKTLRAENVRLQAELADYRRLRQQLAAPARGDFRAVAALMAVRPLDLFGSTYVINRGAVDGVVLGAPVVVYDSVLVGFISELHERTAVVRLTIHPATSLPVEIAAGEIRGRGLAQGQTHTGIAVVTIPQDVPTGAGQSILTVGEPRLVPYGLRVGEIDTLTNEAHEPYQRATLRLPYDPAALHGVVVLVVP